MFNPTNPRTSADRYPAIYFGFQACAIVVWWLWMALVPTHRDLFAPPGRPEILLAFWPADLGLIVVGSLFSCYGVSRDRPWRGCAIWFTCGCLAYATVFCVGLCLYASAPWLPVIVMAPAVAASAVFGARR